MEAIQAAVVPLQPPGPPVLDASIPTGHIESSPTLMALQQEVVDLRAELAGVKATLQELVSLVRRSATGAPIAEDLPWSTTSSEELRWADEYVDRASQHSGLTAQDMKESARGIAILECQKHVRAGREATRQACSVGNLRDYQFYYDQWKATKLAADDLAARHGFFNDDFPAPPLEWTFKDVSPSRIPAPSSPVKQGWDTPRPIKAYNLRSKRCLDPGS